MRKIKNYIQQLLGCMMIGGMLLNASAVYATSDKAQAQQSVATTKVFGVVYDAATLSPLAGVRVVAHGNNRYSAMTNAEGTYSFEIPDFVTLLVNKIRRKKI